MGNCRRKKNELNPLKLELFIIKIFGPKMRIVIHSNRINFLWNWGRGYRFVPFFP